MVSGRFALIALFGVIAARADVTYSRDVSRILQAHCQTCHRDGDIAPFALNGYDDAVTWSRDIQRVITDGTMPPWKPVAGHGSFRDANALSADEKQTLLDWIGNDTPQGDPADMPDTPPVKGDWPLGDPDLVLQMPQVFTPPVGQDVYRCFALPTGLDANAWIGAMDVLPGNRQIVHHVLLFMDSTGTALKKDGADGNPGYDCFGGAGIPVDMKNPFSALDALAGIGGWAPGQRPHYLPDGIGIQLTGKATMVMQVHYHPIGRTGPDQTRVGLYYARSDIQKRLYNVPVVNMDFKIPAGAEKYEVTAKFPPVPLPLAAKVITIYPHMHLLGRQINVDLVDLQKNVTPMIYENNWDFNWQGAYTYTEAVPVPMFSQVKLTCTFDNSANNPKNPNDPLVPVGWGERTTDEMCLAFVGLTLDVDPFTILRSVKPVQ